MNIVPIFYDVSRVNLNLSCFRHDFFVLLMQRKYAWGGSGTFMMEHIGMLITSDFSKNLEFITHPLCKFNIKKSIMVLYEKFVPPRTPILFSKKNYWFIIGSEISKTEVICN